MQINKIFFLFLALVATSVVMAQESCVTSCNECGQEGGCPQCTSQCDCQTDSTINCTMPACVTDCQINTKGGNMDLCTTNCECPEGGCSMKACTTNCIGKGGNCDMPICTTECIKGDCHGEQCPSAAPARIRWQWTRALVVPVVVAFVAFN